jgi:hypothetical protein
MVGAAVHTLIVHVAKAHVSHVEAKQVRQPQVEVLTVEDLCSERTFGTRTVCHDIGPALPPGFACITFPAHGVSTLSGFFS